MTSLRLLAKPLAACDVDELWRGELAMDLARLREADLHVQAATERLDRLLDACPAAQDLLTVDERRSAPPGFCRKVLVFIAVFMPNCECLIFCWWTQKSLKKAAVAHGSQTNKLLRYDPCSPDFECRSGVAHCR